MSDINDLTREELAKLINRELSKQEMGSFKKNEYLIEHIQATYSGLLSEKRNIIREILRKENIISNNLSDLKSNLGESFSVEKSPTHYKFAIAGIPESALDFESAERAYFCGNHVGNPCCGWVKGMPTIEGIKDAYRFGNVFKCRICGMTVGIESETY